MLINIVSVLHQNKGCIRISTPVPETREISWVCQGLDFPIPSKFWWTSDIPLSSIHESGSWQCWNQSFPANDERIINRLKHSLLLENQILCRCLKAKMNQKLSQQKNPEINLIKTTWLYKKCHLSNLLHPEENMVFQFNVYFQELDIDFCHKTDICLSPRRAKSFHNDWWIRRFLFDFQKLQPSLWFQYSASCA